MTRKIESQLEVNGEKLNIGARITKNGQSSRAHHNHPFSRSEPLTPRAQNLKVLGLTPIADQKAIKQAYRKLAKRHHPDRFLTQAYTDPQRTEAARKMREVNQAYDWLCSNA